MCFNINFLINSKTNRNFKLFSQTGWKLDLKQFYFIFSYVSRLSDTQSWTLSFKSQKNYIDIIILDCCTKLKQFESVTFGLWETATGVFLHFLTFLSENLVCQQLKCGKGFTIQVSWSLAWRQIYILKPQQDSNMQIMTDWLFSSEINSALLFAPEEANWFLKRRVFKTNIRHIEASGASCQDQCQKLCF